MRYLDPNHSKLTKCCVYTSDVRCHHIYKTVVVYGPLLHVGDVTQHEERNDHNHHNQNNHHNQYTRVIIASERARECTP